MTRIVGIGSALFDILMSTDCFPAEDTKIQGISSKVQGGGPCAVALTAMSRLGIETEYMGILGDDIFGRFILERFQKYGVGTDHIRLIPGAISYHSFVLSNKKASTRTCIWNKGTVPEPTQEDICLETIANAEFLHLDGHQLETAIYAALYAHKHGVKVSLDAGGFYPGIERLLPYVDILIPSEEFVLKITGAQTAVEAVARLQEKYRPEIFIVTQGARGGFLWREGKEVRYPMFPVKAIDSNGAGDTFHGAFLAAYLKGKNALEAATFASAASALKCTRFGAQDGIPGTDEVERFLREHENRIVM